MYLIYLAFTLLLLWFSMAGLTLLLQCRVKSFELARAIGITTFVLLFFFIEHFIGLGSLSWFLPLGLGLSLYVFWRRKEQVQWRAFANAELVFVAVFIYAFCWRFAFPAISPSSEKITDLFFISNYLAGQTLPPLDNWQPPHLFDYYYAFQHYGAALLGRIFNLSPGLTYNLGFAVLMALPATLAWYIAGFFIQKRSLKALLVCTLIFGGTGFSPIFHLAYQGPQLIEGDSDYVERRNQHAKEGFARENIITSVRFIGGGRDQNLSQDKNLRKGIGSWLLPETLSDTDAGKRKMVLPAENYGYQFFLGDYHPTLGGFFLLLLALALVVSIERGQNQKLCHGALLATVPLMMITNTWTFPLLVILLGVWLAYRYYQKCELPWLWFLGGGVAATFLIYPFLIGFTASPLSTKILFVFEGEHTPFSRFLAMHWPFMILIALSFFEPKHRKTLLSLSVAWLLLLVMSEIFFVDDPTAAQYQRTNSVMKWWGWIHVGVLVSLGGMLLGSKVKWLRWSAIGVMLLLNVALLDLLRYGIYSSKPNLGKMDGHSWYTSKASIRQMFEYLETAPRGVVLESVLDNAYSNSSMYAIFNGKPVLLGWPSHLMTWHGDVPRVWVLKDEIERFYRGEMDNSLAWLQSHDVQYIVFKVEDDNQFFDAINEKIKGAYAWHEFEHSRSRHTGIWVKANKD